MLQWAANPYRIPPTLFSRRINSRNLFVVKKFDAMQKRKEMIPQKKLSVVVPCYNEEDVIHELHKRLTDACMTYEKDGYEIVLVNDGSSDKTLEIMGDIVQSDPNVVVVNLSRNHGHQLALSAGLEVCCGERIFIIDADLQDPPELLHDMMKKVDAGVDVVFGQRLEREGETLFKKASAFVFYRLLQRITDIEIPADTGDFRLMTRRALDVLLKMPEHHRFIRGMVSWIGFKQEPILYARAPRFAGTTKYPLSKMIKFSIDAITSFSIRPLRVAAHAGFAVGLAAFAMIIYALFNFVFGNSVDGWTSIIIVILSIGSVQLVLMGIIGEYLGRLYIESKGRPLFIIQDVIHQQSNNHVHAGKEHTDDQ